MKSIPLNTLSRKTCLLLGSVIFAGLCCAWILNHYRAARWSESMHMAGIKRSVELEPNNADFHFRLGRFYLFAEQDTAASLASFRSAISLNSYEARYWMDSALAHQIEGNRAAMFEAVERAVSVDAKTSSLAWEAANFYLSQGEFEQAFRKFHGVIVNDPANSDQVFLLAWRATQDIELILQTVMPKMVDPHFSLIKILCREERIDEAMITWDRLQASNEPIKLEQALAFVEYLVSRHQIRKAQTVWRYLARFDPHLQSDENNNLLINGDFEHDIPLGGFHWYLGETAATHARISTSKFSSGSRSLQVTFRSATAQADFRQYVPIKANTQYELSVMVLVSDLKTASGPRVTVVDVGQAKLLATGMESRGSGTWRQEVIPFKTGNASEFIMVTMTRDPSHSQIAGNIWLDNMRLTRR